MYVWQSSTGRWEMDFLTSQEKNDALRAAARKITGSAYIMPSYDTRADAEAAMAAIYEVYQS
jgi:hypothetical protein